MLPKQFEFLLKEPAPRMLLEALKLYGVTEKAGIADNLIILEWAKELGLNYYNDDAIPWCFDGESLIFTLDGYKYIKDIKENLDFVYTKDNNFEFVNKVLKRKKQLNKLYVTGALPLLVTDDHPFLVKRIKKDSKKKQSRIYEEELVFTKLKDLQKNDLLCRKKLDIVVNTELNDKNKEFIKLLGVYTAEGTSRKSVVGNTLLKTKSVSASSTIHIGKHELNKITDLIQKSGLLKYTITERRTCFQIEIRDKEFVQHSLQIGCKGIEKQIPYYILCGNEHVKYNFLEGYLEGDGHVNKEKTKGSVSSISKKLILGAGKILLDKGIFPTYREDLREGKHIIEGRTVNVKNRYIIQYTLSKNNKSTYLQDKDYYYLPVKKVINNFKEDIVYDLEVENSHSFIANDLVVHNCGLLIAIVAKRADKTVVKDPLWARNWSNFGKKKSLAMLGDVLVFSRGSSGHVGIYVGETKNKYYVLGGNQGDKVSIVPILKSRLISINAEYNTAQPANVRQILFKEDGKPVSVNEQ